MSSYNEPELNFNVEIQKELKGNKKQSKADIDKSLMNKKIDEIISRKIDDLLNKKIDIILSEFFNSK